MNEHRREAAFETVIETHLLANGYVPVNGDGFDRERAISPEVVLAFVRDTQPYRRSWSRPFSLRYFEVGVVLARRAASARPITSRSRAVACVQPGS